MEFKEKTGFYWIEKIALWVATYENNAIYPQLFDQFNNNTKEQGEKQTKNTRFDHILGHQIW